MAGTVNEPCSWSGHGCYSEGGGIAIRDGGTVQVRCALNAVGKIKQLPDCDLRLPRIRFPLRNRCRDGVVQPEQVISYRTERRYAPEAFRSTKDRPTALGHCASRVMF